MRARHDLGRAESEAHGGVFQEDGIFVGPAGNGKAEGLRKDDVQYALAVGH